MSPRRKRPIGFRRDYSSLAYIRVIVWCNRYFEALRGFCRRPRFASFAPQPRRAWRWELCRASLRMGYSSTNPNSSSNSCGIWPKTLMRLSGRFELITKRAGIISCALGCYTRRRNFKRNATYDRGIISTYALAGYFRNRAAGLRSEETSGTREGDRRRYSGLQVGDERTGSANNKTRRSTCD